MKPTRGCLVLILFCMLFVQTPTEAFFKKKDYKQIFLNNALNAEKRKDDNSAFHSYEKAMYYYKKDTKVIESYAKFCERRQFYDKAQDLYTKLYILTKDKKYFFQSNLCSVKNGKLSDEQLNKILNNKNLTQAQKKQLNQALIQHYSYKNDWEKVKENCSKIPIKETGRDEVTTCIMANAKNPNKKVILDYYLKHNEFYPQDITTINKIITLAEQFKNYKLAEKFVKKLSAFNPSDNGIKYRLAGIYEKQGNWKEAAKVYEGLMRSGDTSEHVKKSYTYVQSELNPKKIVFKGPYVPKPLTTFQLAEKNFYAEWKAKNYEQAQKHLAQMLQEQPNNKKLLKHKVDILISQQNYSDAIKTFEKINKGSLEDEKFLAFLYSKTGDNTKALEIIEYEIIKQSKDKELINLALQYSLASKNWDKAIFYIDKLLVFEPKSEKLLMQGGDLYSLKEDFPSAIKYYKNLVKINPKPEYKQSLANLYMANKDFALAQEIIEPLYEQHPDNAKIVDLYLNSLLAQKKTQDAYWVIKDHKLENTKEGYMVLGDLAFEYKHYNMAAEYYFSGLQLAPRNTILQNKLGDSYRMMGYKTGAAALFNQALIEDPGNLEARLGLGSLETDKKNFKRARKIFYSILSDNPDYRPAKVAIAHSYIANDEQMSALHELDKIPEDNETKLLKAQAYYDMNMLTDSKEKIINTETWDAKDLRYKINRDNAFTIIPSYTGFYQTLANEFRLNYQKYGLLVSQNVNRNANVFMEYNVYWYTSGANTFLSNVTNEFRGGVQSRPTEKWAYRADLGVKAFQNQNAMILTNSWLKYYFNDWFNLKLGFYRNNLEQSYTSAVGQYINGIYTGQVAENKVYLEYEAKLPHKFYSFGRGAYGVMTGQNMITNQFFEGYVGAGKAFYNNPKNPWVNTFAFDVVTYNSAYQYNLLNLYSSTGQLFGGYFSPSYFNATTGNLKLEGYIKKLRLHYGVKAFGGIQQALSPDLQTPTYGYNPYVALDINDHMTINASYNHFTYADMQRDIFMFNLVIRGFKRNAKK